MSALVAEPVLECCSSPSQVLPFVIWPLTKIIQKYKVSIYISADKFKKIKMCWVEVTAHAFNPSIQEAEAGQSLSP